MIRREDLPRIDDIVGRVALRSLVWLGHRALARGDKHEWEHCIQAVAVGHSTHSESQEECHLREVRGAFVAAQRAYIKKRDAA